MIAVDTINPIRIIISIPVFITALCVFRNNKKLAVTIQEIDRKRMTKFMGGFFLGSMTTLSKYGYYRFAAIFIGIMIFLLGWIVAIGTVYSGDAAYDYLSTNPHATIIGK